MEPSRILLFTSQNTFYWLLDVKLHILTVLVLPALFFNLLKKYFCTGYLEFE